jgi:hypothetical protein
VRSRSEDQPTFELNPSLEGDYLAYGDFSYSFEESTCFVKGVGRFP